MTLEEFKKAFKTTDDVKSLVEKHVTATGYGAIEYDGYTIPIEDNNCYISITDEDHITVVLRQINNNLSAEDTYNKICVSYEITAKAQVSIYDILKGSTEVKVYSSDIEVCTSSKTINWENYGEYVPDLYAVIDDNYSIISDAKDIIAKLLPYNIFYFHNSSENLKNLYDQMVQDYQDAGELDEITFEDCKEYFEDIDEYIADYNCAELLDYIDDLYEEDNNIVDKDELDSLAISIVDAYYDGFSFAEIANDVNLDDLHDSDETPDVVTIDFHIK